MTNINVNKNISIETKTKARWFASLSNGENAVEGVGKFEEVENEASPWQKLVAYCNDNQLKVTGMQIRIAGRTYTLPTNSPKFNSQTPIGYSYFRKVMADVMSDKPNATKLAEQYICVIAVYEDKLMYLWVDEMGKKDAWVTIEDRDKASYKLTSII